MSDGGRPPVGGRFRQPDRTPFFRLTPAFGLRSLRKNGYVLTGVDGTGPPTGDRPRRETAAGWRRAKSDESATARSALDKGRHACGSRVKQKQEQDRSYTISTAPREAESLRICAKRCGRSPLGGQGIRVPEWGRQRGRGDG